VASPFGTLSMRVFGKTHQGTRFAPKIHVQLRRLGRLPRAVCLARATEVALRVGRVSCPAHAAASARRANTGFAFKTHAVSSEYGGAFYAPKIRQHGFGTRRRESERHGERGTLVTTRHQHACECASREPFASWPPSNSAVKLSVRRLRGRR